MNPCDNCRLDDLQFFISYCCWKHPETHKSVTLELSNGKIIEACPNLDAEGFCKIYDQRPKACQEYQCPKFYELDLVDLLK